MLSWLALAAVVSGMQGGQIQTPLVVPEFSGVVFVYGSIPHLSRPKIESKSEVPTDEELEGSGWLLLDPIQDEITGHRVRVAVDPWFGDIADYVVINRLIDVNNIKDEGGVLVLKPNSADKALINSLKGLFGA